MSTNLPLVSICIPSYKNSKLLNRCLQSVVDQTYTNIEIIITDDSPNDEVAEVVRNYLSDSRIRYIKNPIALGSPENWNEGIRHAKGDYIKIMHHDDWFATPHALHHFVEKVKETNADFICSYCYNVHPDKKIGHSVLKRFRTKWAENPKLILYANYLGNPSTILFRRPATHPILYDKRSIWFVDILFYYEYVKFYPKVAYIEEYLINTSAGLDTQITNSTINAQVAIGEFIYLIDKCNLDIRNSFLTKLSLVELLKRYNITSKKELETLVDIPLEIQIPYFLLKLPVSHQVFNVMKHLLILK